MSAQTAPLNQPKHFYKTKSIFQNHLRSWPNDVPFVGDFFPFGRQTLPLILLKIKQPCQRQWNMFCVWTLSAYHYGCIIGILFGYQLQICFCCAMNEPSDRWLQSTYVFIDEVKTCARKSNTRITKSKMFERERSAILVAIKYHHIPCIGHKIGWNWSPI